MAKQFKEPIFIPKLLDKAVINSGLDFSHVLIDAHYLFYREDVFQETKSKCPHIIVDPVTHCLQFQQLFEKPSYKKLPYSSVTDIQKILSDPSYRLNSLIVPCIDFQIKMDTAFIIAPYLCTDDINSALFSNNTTMLGETLYILEGRKIEQKVFAPICIGAHILRDNKLVNYVIDTYKDESFYSKISGYFLMVTDLDDRQADEEQLLGLADLVYQLSQEKDVLINHLGGFGDVLNAIGASGFISSPGGGETFSLKQMQEGGLNVRGRKHDQWRYIPELFDYINEVELASDRIDYHCDCYACSHTSEFSSIYAARKTHFLVKKMQLVNEMKNKTREERVKLMIDKLEKGIRLVHGYIARFGSDIKVAHLIRWKKILEISLTWNYQQDDDELAKLLQELG